MKKKSLGIILSGRPSYVQQGNIWTRLLDNDLPMLFLLVPASYILLFVIATKHRPEFSDFVRITWGFVLSMVVSAVLNVWIWDELHRCTYCHHFAKLERISDDKLVDTSQRYVSRNVDDYEHGTAYDLDGNLTFYTNKSSHVEWDKEITKVYTYNIRCSCCGCVKKVERRETKTV